MDVQVNLWAVFLAAVSSMVVGGIWYAKPVFGAMWMKMVKLDEKKAQKGAAKSLIIAFVASLVTAYVLAHVAYLSNNYFGHSFLQDAVMTAFWLWLGLVTARIIVHDAFEMRPMSLTLMNISHELVTLLVMGLIIGWLAP